jgi:hypothetical protein
MRSLSDFPLRAVVSHTAAQGDLHPGVNRCDIYACFHASLARVVLIGAVASVALSGCGVFCGAGGGSGGTFAGGCATGVRF